MRLKDIAEIANLSIATVSKVLNGKTSELSAETIERVERIIEEYGYVPNSLARAMKSNRSNVIGLLIPDIRNPFFTEMARGAEDAAYELGYSLFLCNTDYNAKKELEYIKNLQAMRSAGIAIAGNFKRDERDEAKYMFSVPMVAINRVVHYNSVASYLEAENYKSAKKLVEELYELGYRSFLYLGGQYGSSISNDRFEGTKAGLKDRNYTRFDSVFGEFYTQFGYDMIIQNEDIKKYDMIVCGNDLIAIGVIQALKTLNIEVPAQMGVSGFDNIDLSTTPELSLTTVNQYTYEMGENVVRRLHDIIMKNDYDESSVLKQSIIFRDSTRKK